MTLGTNIVILSIDHDVVSVMPVYIPQTPSLDFLKGQTLFGVNVSNTGHLENGYSGSMSCRAIAEERLSQTM